MNKNVLFELAFANDGVGIVEAAKEGYDPNIIHPRGGHTPLMAACEVDAIDAISALLGIGADPNLRFTRTSRVNGRVWPDHTAIMHVKSISAASMLVDAGANVNVRDADGANAIVFAIEAADPVLVEYLFDKGVDPIVEFRSSGTTSDTVDFVREKIRVFREVVSAHDTEEERARLARLERILSFL